MAAQIIASPDAALLREACHAKANELLARAPAPQPAGAEAMLERLRCLTQAAKQICERIALRESGFVAALRTEVERAEAALSQEQPR